MQRRRRRAMVWVTLLAALLVLETVLSAALGAAQIPPQVTAGVLLESVGLRTAWSAEATDSQRQIVRTLRLPRIVVAALVGAGLAMAGATMQAVLRNPMADPGIVGVSAGGALGAVAAIASGAVAMSVLALPLAAFAGALVATTVVFLFSLRHGRSDVAALLLAGLAVTYLCSAATSALIAFSAERDALREIVFWLLGGFDNRGWEHVALVLPAVLFGGAVLLLYSRTLNLLALGEEEAHSLGVNVQRTRAVLLTAAALITGVAVAVSGLVGFVGLVVPHLMRLLLGSSDYRLLLPLSALGGAVFLLAADTLARTVLQPMELRVGIVTAFVGAPFFLFVLARQRRRALLLTGLLLVAGCAPTTAPPPAVPTARPATVPTTLPTPVLGAARAERKAVIVEPRATPGAFPRTVRDVNGEVTIPARPMRIHTLSVGFDEITLRLVDPSRVIAVGASTVSPDFSNVVDVASQIPNRVGRDAEQIIALQPDLVVSSPFANTDLLRRLQGAGVRLVIADLVSSVDAQQENIRFLAYLYGEEGAGEALVSDVNDRLARLAALTARVAPEKRVSAIVLSGGQTLSVAGSGTTEDGVLQVAGARNAAASLSGNKDVSVEALPAMDPTFIVVIEANTDKPTLLPRLQALPVVTAMPAWKAGRVIVIRSSLVTTLSQWNVAGAEELYKQFYGQ